MNFSKNKILFRCDAGKVPEIGTGHLYRSIAIATILKKKYNLEKNQILFITKNKGKFNISLKILDRFGYKYNIYSDKLLLENSATEIKILKENKADILIIDRWGNASKKTLKILKQKFKKIILIDDRSKYSKMCNLTLNSLIPYKNKYKKNYKAFDNLILPSYNNRNLVNKKNKRENNYFKKVFISFGGFDKNSFTKIVAKQLIRSNLPLKIFLHYSFKKIRC